MPLYDVAKGRISRKTYKRLGILRDQNLADLSSPSRGLENLLDQLVTIPGGSFLSNDVKAIENIFSIGLTNGNYLSVIGSASFVSTPTGGETAFEPKITYQNRLDKFRVFAGEPRLNGGDGLTAKYYQNDQINFNTHADFVYDTNVNTEESEVFLNTTNLGTIEPDNFWEVGNFEYTNKIHPQSVKANTGVKWEGYYVPTRTGKAIFRISSTGYYTMDFQSPTYEENANNVPISGIGNTYISTARVGLTTTINCQFTGNNTIVIGDAIRLRTIGVGMTVTGSDINGTPTVEVISRSTGIITLTPESGNSTTKTSGTGNVLFAREIGEIVHQDFETPVLIAFQKYRIRLRFFFPKNIDVRKTTKSFNFDYFQPGFGNYTDLRFNYLYTLGYDFSDSAKGSFNKFDDQSVLSGGTNLYTTPIGIGSRDDNSKYVKIKSTKKVDITYSVKKELGNGDNRSTGIVRQIKTLSTTANDPVLSFGITSQIEVGNYVFGTDIPDGTRIAKIITNQFVILDSNPTSTVSSNQLTFINHRGFVRKVTGSCTSGTVTLSGGTKIRADNPDSNTLNTDGQEEMVIIGSGIPSFTKINSITSVTEFDVVQPSGSSVNFSSTDIFVYQSRGLKDNSIRKFCNRITPPATLNVKCLRAKVTSGQFINIGPNITVEQGSTSNIAQSGKLLGSYFGENGITISSITPNSPAGFDTIVLSSNILAPIPNDSQFTYISNNSPYTDDRQLCCPPNDTSPPFEASEEGLITKISSNPQRPNLGIQDGGGHIKFDNLTLFKFAKNTNTGVDITGIINNVINDPITTYDKNIKIKTETSGTFNILASSTP